MMASRFAQATLLLCLSAQSVFSFSSTRPLALHGHGVAQAQPNLRSTMTPVENEQKPKRDISDLPLPPNQGMNFFRNIRDSVSYLSNPDRFVADRSAKLGPVFLSYQFFKPAVFCGGQQNVQEFISGTELKSKVIYPALPEIFVELHTKVSDSYLFHFYLSFEQHGSFMLTIILFVQL